MPPTDIFRGRGRGEIAQIEPAQKSENDPKVRGKIQIEIVLADLTKDPRSDPD